MEQVSKHLIPVVRRIRSMPVSPPPPPWRRVGNFAVGGLTGVGFGRGTDMLLVVSHQGRGVFDCSKGERIARDPSLPEIGAAEWENTIELEALGIGPLDGKAVRMSGLFGGGLPTGTADGWTAERLTLDWPWESLLLVPPGSWVYGDAFGKRVDFTKVNVDSEIRAWGFSPTGKILVLANSSTLTIIGRS
jgi:hypothetical protein